jgi:hypothetical protein
VLDNGSQNRDTVSTTQPMTRAHLTQRILRSGILENTGD